MNQKSMESIVKKNAKKSEGEGGVVSFTYKETEMYLISDSSHNRMRIITPVADYSALKKEHIDAAMESNFHHSLDARYALSKGVLYAAYIHPLSSLTEEQIKSAMEQVANLKHSFGDGYTSGVLSYRPEKH